MDMYNEVQIEMVRSAKRGDEARWWSEGCQVWTGTTFFGVAGFLVCQRWLWMVTASTLADMVLAGIWLNCFLSELYL